MKKNKIINIVILFVALFVIGLSLYFYFQLREVKTNLKEGVTEEVKTVVLKVSELYLLPEGEDPTVATVSDPTILKDQSFFNSAEKGDKVLIYNKAGKAVLYRPSIDKIIEIAPIKNDPMNLKNNQNVEFSDTKIN
jgi:hypothetical protein